ncbi:MAG: tripartite tricarboxylate transporter TctB family protein [Sulfurifustaceae bacterium]
MTISNAKDFWAGALYVLVGLAAIFFARDYGMGTATKMGPAYFPTVLGSLLAVIGVVSILRSFVTKGEPIGKFTVKGVLYVCGSIVLFGLLLRGAGVVISLILLVLISAYASSKFRVGTAALLAVGLTVASVLIFVKGLGIPLPLLGYWFGG